MVTRSTSSAFYPPPPGKVIPKSGVFRNHLRFRVVNANASTQTAGSANCCTAPVAGTSNAQYKVLNRVIG